MSLISIIIPAKNESSNIEATIDGIRSELKKENYDYDIIVVNDGSTDGTGRRVKQLAEDDSGVRIIRNRPPYGFGNAIKKGLDNFRGDIVIIMMADASDDPKDMIKYVKGIEEGNDCCFGTRWNKESEVVDYPRYKYVLNRMVNGFISLLFGIRYNDTTNAFKSYSKETILGIKPILSRHFNITVELPLKAIVRGYTFSVVPTAWRQRKEGKSRLKLQEMGSRYLFIIIYVFLEKLLTGSDYKKDKQTAESQDVSR